MKINLKSNICLLTAAIVWGLAFVFQDIAAEKLSHFTINGLRCLIAFISLMPLVIYKSKKNNIPILENTKEKRKDLLKAGIFCGLALFFAMNLQQLSISLYPSDIAASGRTGFIVGLYAVLVPIVCFILFKKKTSINVIISVIIAAVGLYLLCFGKSFNKIELGDIINMVCALCFAIHIIVVDRYIGRADGIKISALQLLTCGSLSIILALIFEQPNIKDINSVIFSILYLGIFSSGLAYTMQILGQQYSNNPTVDALIMSLESVFAVLGGMIILGEKLSIKEGIGCALMFLAIILAQLPIFNKEKKNV